LLDEGRPMHEYDKSSKWLIEHHGDSILRLGGVRGIEWRRSLQAELVQSRQLPDGLIEAKQRRQAKPVRFLVEISTYPYRRLNKQVVEGTALSYLNHGELLEVLTLVLHPGGRKRVAGVADVVSPHGWTRLHLEWKVVELWTISAVDLLAAEDLGLIPWVPLAKIDGPPEPIFRECRARIDRDAPRGDRENLLGVTQLLAHLNYNDPWLFQVLGGRKATIESPVLKELMAENTLKTMRAAIIEFLAGRFGREARALRPMLKAIEDGKQLKRLLSQSGRCPDLESFKKLLEP
jgi:hypothetical protein